MQAFSSELVQRLSALHLLKHPFYESWSKGELSRDALGVYARQYYHHVAAFPRYVSAVHSGCDDLATRQLLLENLIEEERGTENHPELWLRFADALGVDRAAVKEEALLPETKALIDTFLDLSRQGCFTEGLAALFAYEQQVPEVAASKIDGLKKFYAMTDERALSFFTAHLTADVVHSQQEAALLDAVPAADREKTALAAERAARALWGFLDGVQRVAGCH